MSYSKRVDKGNHDSCLNPLKWARILQLVQLIKNGSLNHLPLFTQPRPMSWHKKCDKSYVSCLSSISKLRNESTQDGMIVVVADHIDGTRGLLVKLAHSPVNSRGQSIGRMHGSIGRTQPTSLFSQLPTTSMYAISGEQFWVFFDCYLLNSEILNPFPNPIPVYIVESWVRNRNFIVNFEARWGRLKTISAASGARAGRKRSISLLLPRQFRGRWS